MNEIWKDIEGYEGLYQISNRGRVKSLKRITKLKENLERTEKERILKQYINDKGYLYISLSKNGKRKLYRVHRLVAQIFISNPHNLLEINHKDENKLNNCVDNLEWCSHDYNIRYGNGQKIATISRCKKINQYDLEGNFIKTWESIKEATIFFKNTHIRDVLKGRRKIACNSHWKYKT